MENIYNDTLAEVEKGARAKINLQNRSLRVNGKFVIKEGAYDGNLGVEHQSTKEVLKEIERLYARYRHSIPSERSDSQRRIYFHALPEHQLSDEDMLYGERREYVQIALELYILCSILNGSLIWDDFAKGKWFWKSPNADGLIILKDWINSNSNK